MSTIEIIQTNVALDEMSASQKPAHAALANG